MGMFDTVSAKVRCGTCGEIQNVCFQTKDLECQLRNYKEGSPTCYYENDDYGNYEAYTILEPSTFDYKCDSCNSIMELIAIVRTNRIVRVLDGRLLKKEIL